VFDPEDEPSLKDDPEFVRIRSLKPWRNRYPGWEQDKAFLNVLYAQTVRAAYRPGLIVVSNMAASNSWCNACNGVRVISFFRRPEDIEYYMIQRGGGITPLEVRNSWFEDWIRANYMTNPRIIIPRGKFLSDYLDLIERAISLVK